MRKIIKKKNGNAIFCKTVNAIGKYVNKSTNFLDKVIYTINLFWTIVSMY